MKFLRKRFIGIPHFIAFCFIVLHRCCVFLQIEPQTLPQQKYYYLRYCSARFIVVVWNQTHNVSELCLHCFYTWVFPELRFSLCTIYFSHSKEVFDKNVSTLFYNLFTYWSITWKWYWSQYSGGFLLTDVSAHSVRIVIL